MSGIVVRPGDVVLVQLTDDYRNLDDYEQARKRINEQMEEMLPDCKVIVMRGVQALGVYRPDPAVADE